MPEVDEVPGKGTEKMNAGIKMSVFGYQIEGNEYEPGTCGVLSCGGTVSYVRPVRIDDGGAVTLTS